MEKIMVIAGEASGDMHAARVVEELKKINPKLEFIGMGGQRMAEAGVELLYDPTKLSTIGFIEAVKHLRLMYRILSKLEEAMKEEEPAVILLVDYSGFNMKVAKVAQRCGIPAVNYFAPSAWVWGQWRANKMAKRDVTIASVFPMEEQVYREAGAEVEFVGHPILDIVDPNLDTTEFCREYNLSSEKTIVGLLPGSRQQEVDALLASMLEAASQLQERYQRELKFLLPVADTIANSELEAEIKQYDLEIELIAGQSYQVMKVADLLLTASGTATLEAACFKTPMVIVYKTSLSTYLLGKLLVKIPYVGLPNVIAEEEVVPELLQGAVTGDKIADEALNILNSNSKQEDITEKLDQVINRLGEQGAIKRVAKLVLATGGISNGAS
ncbi:lipid-A-disaccharide synthase [Natroniella sulfidigena]|uniref:lipid-A-disaccharide synthase n=1 Tax=Natroniella sulfidigena TaxID=723921 RepID=UPI00200B7E2C|nr:lipid-A-disaccharide synthase [Natroniella sulfidigena]MCK8816355.1 lipid-A-disaccharide synthase [Natroniella sulfidigena]